jgi:glycine/D-amino acid oxidase-like deaminating enzyme
MELDVLIFGGGATGLWLLDQLSRRGDRILLLEAGRLGEGQTVASQGIIHGGLKYTLQGLLTPAAREIREMPDVWRQCLAGRRAPDLRNTRVRAECCHLWRSDSLRSRLGMLGARVGLHVAPREVSGIDRPDVLAGCPGPVARLEEQVISPASFIADLAGQHRPRILTIDSDAGLQFMATKSGATPRIRIEHPITGQPAEISAGHIVLAAGSGNAVLRGKLGLPPEQMQKRPLHMVLVRGDLPVLNGHCVDGARTRVTITSDRDSRSRMVWQVGGQLAEDGVACDEQSLVCRARDELLAILPGVDISGCEWASYRVDRAERAMPRGGRPDTAGVIADGNILTVWPTKLALAPQAAHMVAACVPCPHLYITGQSVFDPAELADWPRPDVALPPWETPRIWHRLDRGAPASRAA